MLDTLHATARDRLDEIHREPAAVQVIARAKAKEWLNQWGGGYTAIEFIAHTWTNLKAAREEFTALMAMPREERITLAFALRAKRPTEERDA